MFSDKQILLIAHYEGFFFEIISVLFEVLHDSSH